MQTQLDLIEIKNITIADFLARSHSSAQIRIRNISTIEGFKPPPLIHWDIGGTWIDIASSRAAGVS